MKKNIFLFAFVFLIFNTYSQEKTNSNDSLAQNQSNESTIITQVVDWYMGNLNYYTVTFLMTIESSFIPFPSEVVIPPAAYAACNQEYDKLYITEYKWINILIVLFFGTIGALLGALINYFLALYLGRPIVYKFADSKLGHLLLLDSQKVKKAEDYFIKHGNVSTFIGRLIPGIRQLISIPAGLSKMKMRSFLLYTALGAFIWNLILAILGYVAHGNQDIINKYSKELSYVLLGLFVLFLVYVLFQAYRKKKQKNID